MKQPLATLFSLLLAVVLVGSASHASSADDKPSTVPAVAKQSTAETAKPKFTTRSLRGKVVFLAAAMKRLYGVQTDADAAEQAVALEASDAKLYPIVKDFRGRGFLLDPRLRGIEVELLVRQYDGSPLVQVVRVYTIKKGRKYELDYWCDICAIPMYELKACECCQGPTRIREQLVEPDASPAEEEEPKSPTK
jgi:hypothetical protein